MDGTRFSLPKVKHFMYKYKVLSSLLHKLRYVTEFKIFFVCLKEIKVQRTERNEREEKGKRQLEIKGMPKKKDENKE